MNTSQRPSFRNDRALRQTLGYFAMFICLGLGTGLSGPMLPTLAEQLHIRISQMSWSFPIGSVGYILGTYFGSRIFDRIRGHPLLGIAQIVSAAVTFTIPFIPWLWLFLLLSFFKAFSDGVINTGANTLLVWTHGSRSGPYMNALHFSFGLGAFISPLILAQVLEIPGGYRWVYGALAALGLLVGLWLLSLSESSKPIQHASGQTQAAARMNYAMVLTGMLFLFFYVGSEITFGNWVFTYATTLGLAGKSQAAYLTSVFWFSFTVGRLLSIPLATRVAPSRTISIALTGCLLSIALLAGVPGSAGILWVSAIALGFFMAPVWPTGFTLVGQSMTLTARASGIVLLGDSLGGMVLPWVVGQVLESLGIRAMVWLVLASLIGNMLAFAGIMKLRVTAHKVIE